MVRTQPHGSQEKPRAKNPDGTADCRHPSRAPRLAFSLSSNDRSKNVTAGPRHPARLLQHQHARAASPQVDCQPPIPLAENRQNSLPFGNPANLTQVRHRLQHLQQLEEKPILIQRRHIANGRREDILPPLPVQARRLIELQPHAQDIAIALPLLQSLVLQRQPLRRRHLPEKSPAQQRRNSRRQLLRRRSRRTTLRGKKPHHLAAHRIESLQRMEQKTVRRRIPILALAHIQHLAGQKPRPTAPIPRHRHRIPQKIPAPSQSRRPPIRLLLQRAMRIVPHRLYPPLQLPAAKSLREVKELLQHQTPPPLRIACEGNARRRVPLQQ